MIEFVSEVSSEVLELAHLYETAPFGMCVTDTDHRFVRINQRLCDIHGKPLEEHIGRTIHDVIPGISEQVVSVLQRVIDSSEPVLAQEIRGSIQASPNGERAFLTDKYPLLSRTGRVVYVHSIVREVTPTILEVSNSTSGVVGPVRPRSNTLANLLAGGSLALVGHGDLTLGQRLMVARERCGLTKVAVARVVLDPGEHKKPPSATIAAWERETMGLTLPSLWRLADLYEESGDISPSWVVLGDGPIKKRDPQETL